MTGWTPRSHMNGSKPVTPILQQNEPKCVSSTEQMKSNWREQILDFNSSEIRKLLQYGRMSVKGKTMWVDYSSLFVKRTMIFILSHERLLSPTALLYILKRRCAESTHQLKYPKCKQTNTRLPATHSEKDIICTDVAQAIMKYRTQEERGEKDVGSEFSRFRILNKQFLTKAVYFFFMFLFPRNYYSLTLMERYMGGNKLLRDTNC